MNRFLQSIKVLLLILFSFFSNNAFGQGSLTITRSSLPSGALVYGEDDLWTTTTTTGEVVTGYFDIFSSPSQTNMQTRTSTPIGSYPYNVVAMPGNITKITLTGVTSSRTWQPYLSTTALTKSNYTTGISQGVQTVPSGGSVSWTIPSSSGFKYFYINLTGSGAAYLTSIVIEYETAPTCAPPTVSSTTSSTVIGTTTASLSGNVSAIGGGTAVTAKGFDYSTASTMASPTRVTDAATGIGPISYNVTGLVANTLYYYRAYATNDCAPAQTAFSHTSGYPSFTTLPIAPVSSAGTAITSGSFTANWSLPTQGSATRTYSLEYSTDNGFVTPTVLTPASTATNVNITGLQPNTTYYYRIKVSNAAGDSAWSDIQTVTTLAGATYLAYNPAPPATGTVGINLTSFKVEARRPDNSIDTGYTGAVSLTRTIVTGTGNLTGTITSNAIAGVATFGAVQLDGAGTYTITASSGSLASVTSGDVLISPNPVFGYFRSKLAGNWGTLATWETSADGVTWAGTAATAAPTSNAAGIIIKNNVTVNAANTTSKNITVQEGYSLIVSNSFTMNGTNVINGTLRRSSTASFTNNGTLSFTATGVYDHAINGGSIVTATWDPASTAMVTGMAATNPDYSSLSQVFGNFIWDSKVQTAFANFDSNAYGFEVKGLFSILSTGSNRSISLSGNQDDTNTYNFGGILVKNNAMLQFSFRNGNTPAGLINVNVAGDVDIENTATLDMGAGTAAPSAGDYRSIMRLGGNLKVATGATIGASGSYYGKVEFDNTTEKNLSVLSNNTVGVDFDILSGSKVKLTDNFTLGLFNGFNIWGQLDLGTNQIVGVSGGKNSFFNYPDSTLKIAHPQGIASLLSYPTTGAVRVDANGTDDYDTGGNYYYYGTVNQVTGNGLPAIVKNITINNTGATNANEVTLTNAELGVTDNLHVDYGILNLNGREVIGGGVAASELKVAANAILKISALQTFPKEFGTITLSEGSLVDYAGGNQSIANTSVTGYSNMPNYSNLKISGTGVKSAIGITKVNNIVTVTGGELKLPETANNIASNVLWATNGIQNEGGIVTFENNAILMQDATAVNDGNIKVLRKANVPDKQYNLWASPVQNQDLYALYGTPNSVASGKVMEYITKTDFYKPVAAGTTSIWGKGYSVAGLSIADVVGNFVGKPNNGSGQVTLSVEGNRFNAVGNPYPSNLDIHQLYEDNKVTTSGISNITPTMYFWDNTNNAALVQLGTQYLGQNYAIYNALGSIGIPATQAAGHGDATKIPDGTVKPGQGFIVKANTSGDHVLKFNNAQRIETANPTTPYYKGINKSNRYWLALETPTGLVNTIAVAYHTEAKNQYDPYDSSIAGSSYSDLFYSLSDDDYKLAIQSRKGDFDDEDIIKLGSKNFKEGLHKISISKTEGIFDNGTKIYLYDKLLKKYTDLTAGAYVFDAKAIIDDSRFEIVYKESFLGTSDIAKSDIEIYNTNDSFVVKSKQKINKVELYDIAGRLLYVVDKEAHEVKVSHLDINHGVYVLKVYQQSKAISKKVIK